jgi:hypothetical protein
VTSAEHGEYWREVRSTVRAITVGLTVAGTPKTITSQSCRLCGWSLTAGSAAVPSTITGAFAAGASGTATLPAGQGISGFSVTLGTFTVANTATVTITGAVGGTVTYTLLLSPSAPGPITFTQDFVPALQPANPAVAIVVTFNGNVNSPGGNIVAYGATGAAANATLFDSGQPLGQPAAAAGLTDTQWLSDYGVYVSTNLILNVASGSLQGVVYVRDNWERSD